MGGPLQSAAPHQWCAAGAGPGDKRDKRAVFVGSDSGMLEGRRRALVRLSRSRPKDTYARFVEGGLQPYEDDLEDYKDMVVPKMNMSDQIDMFRRLSMLEVSWLGAAKLPGDHSCHDGQGWCQQRLQERCLMYE